jgi:DNA replication protein DnaC
MLNEPTIEKLKTLKLHGMVRALEQIQARPSKDLSPSELLGLLVDAEALERENRGMTRRLAVAKLRHPACVEDIDWRHARGLKKSSFLELQSSRWVQGHQNVILTGPTGIGKSWLACALGQKACRDGFSVLYRRASRLFDEIYQSRADGSYPRLLSKVGRCQLLILDDFALSPLEPHARYGLLDLLEERYERASTLITSQLAPEHWHTVIGDATVADAICDRLIHGAHRIILTGESMRKAKSQRKEEDKNENA